MSLLVPEYTILKDGIELPSPPQIVNMRASQGKEKSGSFEINFHNPNYKYSGTFDVNNQLIIYIQDKSSTKNELVLNGVITDVDYEWSTSGRLIAIRGVDYTKKLFDQIYTGVHTSETADAIVKTILEDTVNSKLPSGQYISDNNVQSAPGTITNIEFINKPVIECFNILAADENTGGGNYLVYVDHNRSLHFEPKHTSFDTELEEGIEIVSARLTRGLHQAVNAIIFNAGEDTSGNAIWDEYHYNESIIKYGWMWDTRSYTFIAEEIKKYNSGWTDAQIRTEAKRRGKARAQKEIENNHSPKFSGNIEIKGTNSYNVGNKIKVKSDMINNPDGLTFIISEITQDLSKNGWFTSLSIEEELAKI